MELAVWVEQSTLWTDCRVEFVFWGQSSGGHNVVWGLHETLKIQTSKRALLGFLVMMLTLTPSIIACQWLHDKRAKSKRGGDTTFESIGISKEESEILAQTT